MKPPLRFPGIFRHARAMKVSVSHLFRMLTGKRPFTPALKSKYEAILYAEEIGLHEIAVSLPIGTKFEITSPEDARDALIKFGNRVRLEGSSMILQAPMELRFSKVVPQPQSLQADKRSRPYRARGRNWGRTSPLNKLAPGVTAELNRLFDEGETLREIQLWLAESHGFKTSTSSLSEYGIRRRDEVAPAASPRAESIYKGGEIEVSAVGPNEIRVKVVSPAPGQTGDK